MRGIFIIALFFLASCAGLSPRKDTAHSSPISFAIPRQTREFSECFKNIRLDTGNRMLQVRLELADMKKFRFPVEIAHHDTLSRTAFLFEFYQGGKAVPIVHAVVFPAKNQESFTNYYYGTVLDSLLRFSSDTVDLRYTYSLQAAIPMYAFQKVKQGVQDFELRISQNVFCSKDHTLEKTLIGGAATFKLQVPAIYQTTLIGQGLVLRNDSSWSPAGMDNTIWKSSYPDIYWTLEYPTGMHYGKTAYETSTDRYTGIDTFRLYHYSPADSVEIGVWDHDNLSRDDYLGVWEGSLKRLCKEKQANLGFGHVKWFGIRAVPGGVINK